MRIDINKPVVRRQRDSKYVFHLFVYGQQAERQVAEPRVGRSGDLFRQAVDELRECAEA